MRPRNILIGVGVLIIAGFAYYAISPVFRNIKVDEAPPGAQGAGENIATTTYEGMMDEAMPGESGSVQGAAGEEPGAGSMPEEGTSMAMAMVGGNPAEVMGTLGHPASGTVRVVEAGGKYYLRYENFKTLNGPDIFVYLAADKDAKDFISLGRVKATEGNINYEIPPGTDLSKYRYALTWCRAFSVLFNSADLASAQ